MKICHIRVLFSLFFLFLGFPFKSISQEPSTEIAIKSSVICEMCKKKVEKTLIFKGIQKTTVDLNTKIITVVYNPQETTPEKIKSAIVKTGYDADELKADPKAYKKLEKCCKKENQHL